MNSAPESVHREPRERPDSTHIPGRERRKNAGQGVSRRKVQETAKPKRGERRVPYAFANRVTAWNRPKTSPPWLALSPLGYWCLPSNTNEPLLKRRAWRKLIPVENKCRAA